MMKRLPRVDFREIEFKNLNLLFIVLETNKKAMKKYPQLEITFDLQVAVVNLCEIKHDRRSVALQRHENIVDIMRTEVTNGMKLVPKSTFGTWGERERKMEKSYFHLNLCFCRWFCSREIKYGNILGATSSETFSYLRIKNDFFMLKDTWDVLKFGEVFFIDFVCFWAWPYENSTENWICMFSSRKKCRSNYVYVIWIHDDALLTFLKHVMLNNSLMNS